MPYVDSGIPGIPPLWFADDFEATARATIAAGDRRAADTAISNAIVSSIADFPLPPIGRVYPWIRPELAIGLAIGFGLLVLFVTGRKGRR